MLVVTEPHERHVLIRCPDEADPLIGPVPLEPGQLLVLATPGAHRQPSLMADLPALLSDFLGEVESVWLGIGSLAADTDAAQRLAVELDVEVVAPDGGVAAMPGAALYAGHTAGGTGWYRFGSVVSFHGARFPLPEWESWLPSTPVEVDGVVFEPVPCGLAGASELAFDVPVNQRFPKVVVGSGLSPAGVAALLGGLPDRPIMLVPTTPEAASHIWLAELAMRLSREVVFSAGTQVRTRSGKLATMVPEAAGNRLYRPFPLVLRQTARGGDQQVLDIAAPPPGWERAGRRSYRRADGGDVVADVVPSGLVLRPVDGELPAIAEAAPFDPEGWTLTLGTTGQVVGLPVLTAAEDLLAALPPEQRAVVRVRMAGMPDEEAELALDRFAHRRGSVPVADSVSGVEGRVDGGLASPPGVSTPSDPRDGTSSVPSPPAPVMGDRSVVDRSMGDRPVVPVPPVPVGPEPVPPPAGPSAPVGASPSSFGSVPGAGLGERPAVDRPVLPVASVGGMPPIVTTSAAPVSTVSGPPVATRRPERGEAEGVAAADPGEPVASDGPREVLPAEPERTVALAVGPPPAGESAPAAVEATGPSLAVPVRASTGAEQTRFAAAAGESFGEALAIVNAALATWPSMRVDESLGAKADYVAVCLFLGRGDGSALAINGALRVGQSGVLAGQVPCLMSGIRRLPTHRRAVLRQGRVNESLEHRSQPGTVLTEPGFLAASIDLDVTVPGADLDVLIWPSSARRTSELMLGRPIDEAVFVAGARFKALAVRTAEEDDDQDDDGTPVAPRVAVLYRELAPGETPETTELDERDLAVLAKLDGVLARRHQGPLRLVEDPDVTARLTTSMVAWQQEAADAGRTTAVAS